MNVRPREHWETVYVAAFANSLEGNVANNKTSTYDKVRELWPSEIIVVRDWKDLIKERLSQSDPSIVTTLEIEFGPKARREGSPQYPHPLRRH